MTNLDRLRELLKDHSHGKVQNTILGALMNAWDEITGTEFSSLYAYKLVRAESLEWHPPFLTFTIERQGGTVLGSSRAELYKWHVNVETGEAEAGVSGRRQLYPMDKRLDTQAIAVELRGIIEQQAQTIPGASR